MIVSYALSLRSGGTTITIPSIETSNSQELLNHIQHYCMVDYNDKLTFKHDYLTEPNKILVLFFHL